MPLLSHSPLRHCCLTLKAWRGNAKVRFEPIDWQPGAGWHVLITLRYGKQPENQRLRLGREARNGSRPNRPLAQQYNSGLQA